MTNRQMLFLKSVGVANESDAARNMTKAAFQRNQIYHKKPSEKKSSVSNREREKLHNTLIEQVKDITKEYGESKDEQKHCDNICKLAESLSKTFGKILNNKRFTIGTAQKALNLYLKFLWCLGIRKEAPPHCPLDGKILRKVRIYKSWTKLDCIETYKEWMNNIPKPIAEWELENWERNS